jgi:hypothetical protein
MGINLSYFKLMVFFGDFPVTNTNIFMDKFIYVRRENMFVKFLITES